MVESYFLFLIFSRFFSTFPQTPATLLRTLRFTPVENRWCRARNRFGYDGGLQPRRSLIFMGVGGVTEPSQGPT
jgi:hypothetical protein